MFNKYFQFTHSRRVNIRGIPNQVINHQIVYVENRRVSYIEFLELFPRPGGTYQYQWYGVAGSRRTLTVNLRSSRPGLGVHYLVNIYV